MDTTYENVIKRLSERGKVEWDLAVALETTSVLQSRIVAANADIERLENEAEMLRAQIAASNPSHEAHE